MVSEGEESVNLSENTFDKPEPEKEDSKSEKESEKFTSSSSIGSCAPTNKPKLTPADRNRPKSIEIPGENEFQRNFFPNENTTKTFS